MHGAPQCDDVPPHANLAVQVMDRYPQIGTPTLVPLHDLVHEVVAVESDAGRFALKLYRPGVRAESDVRWEAELARHLADHDLGVAAPIPGRHGLVERLDVAGRQRLAVLSEWVPGVKPAPSSTVYSLLGETAALIHEVADGYQPRRPRADTDLETLVRAPVRVMRPLLDDTGAWPYVSALAERLCRYVETSDLEWGVCHHDLTLDNVHLDGGRLRIFDFDSAGPGWRAIEGQGVYSSAAQSGSEHWAAWKRGYRSVRTLRPEDEAAVPYFVLAYEIGNVAWKLGLTETSVGRLVSHTELTATIESWRRWERSHLS